jgi:predicted GTPase
MLEILPDACVNTLDKAGRTVLHWAVAHDITWAVEELLESGKARPDVTFQTAYIRNITAFHLILLHVHNLPYSYRRYLKDELKRDFANSNLLTQIFPFLIFDRNGLRTFLYCGQYEWVGTNS